MWKSASSLSLWSMASLGKHGTGLAERENALAALMRSQMLRLTQGASHWSQSPVLASTRTRLAMAMGALARME